MVNATQLSSYIYCPRKLFIGSVLEIKEPPKKELVRGKVWHQSYELINKNESSIVKSILPNSSGKYDEIFDLYRKGFAKFLRNAIIMNKSELKKFEVDMLELFNEYWPHFEEEAKTRALNVSVFIRKSGLFGEQLWDSLTPKIISEQYFKSEKSDVSGIIDMIEVHDNELYVPVEFKTGKFPASGMWDGHRMQLGAYLVMLEDSGKKVSEGVLKYKDSDEKRILVMDSMLRREVVTAVSKANLIIKNFDLPGYVDNKNKCAKCSFKDICYDETKMRELIDLKKASKNV
ncbi:MAG: CRISPR-associated protein Cas4 [Candidatus Woesearchaeota archaeon]